MGQEKFSCCNAHNEDDDSEGSEEIYLVLRVLVMAEAPLSVAVSFCVMRVTPSGRED